MTNAKRFLIIFLCFIITNMISTLTPNTEDSWQVVFPYHLFGGPAIITFIVLVFLFREQEYDWGFFLITLSISIPGIIFGSLLEMALTTPFFYRLSGEQIGEELVALFYLFLPIKFLVFGALLFLYKLIKSNSQKHVF